MRFIDLMDRVQGKAPKGAKRSKDWPKVRRLHLKMHPQCAVCEGTKKLDVHHGIPFHFAPDLELDPDNLYTLCRHKKYGIICHQLMGHLGNYRRINPNCRIDIMTWNIKLRAR